MGEAGCAPRMPPSAPASVRSTGGGDCGELPQMAAASQASQVGESMVEGREVAVLLPLALLLVLVLALRV